MTNSTQESPLRTSLREYMSFLKHEASFGPRVLAKDMLSMLSLVNQKADFQEMLDFTDETSWTYTLFFTARNLQSHYHWLEQFLEQGHEIASHSYSHVSLPSLSDAELRNEFTLAEQAFNEFGLKPIGLRTPFLLTDSRISELAHEFGFKYLSCQHGGDPHMYLNGVWEFPVLKPYDWFGLVRMKLIPHEISRLWEQDDGMVTLIHPRYFGKMEDVVINHHKEYRNDRRVCSHLRRPKGNQHPKETALSFDIY